MNLKKDDTDILIFLSFNPGSTSTKIAKNVYENKTTYVLIANTNKVRYKLSKLKDLGLIDNEHKNWSVTDKVIYGVAKIVFTTDEEELSIGVGPSLLIVQGKDYEIVEINDIEFKD